MRRLFPLLIAIIIPIAIFGQNQANIWHFGDGAGLDFNTVPPTAITTGATYNEPTQNHSEGTSVICDDTGGLLFYSNGEQVWDKNHTVMPNGTNLLGHLSSTQSSLIVPMPGSQRYFYLFTNDGFFEDTLKYGLRYSIVDMCLNNDNGDILPNRKNVFLLDYSSEKLTAVKHSNNRDYWIITQKYDTNNFHAYLLSPAGISDSLISSVGTIHRDYCVPTTNPTKASMGMLKASPNGSRLVCLSGQGCNNISELFNFNRFTGAVTNPINLNTDATAVGLYGASFSPDSRKLYISSFINNDNVYQYDLTSNIPATIIASKTIVAQHLGGPWYMGMSLGPDGKIYVAVRNQTAISVINNPNLLGGACGFVDGAVPLNGRFCSLGLPNLLDSYTYTNTTVDCLIPQACSTPGVNDKDNDGVADPVDNDKDNDGIVDINEVELSSFDVILNSGGRQIITYNTLSHIGVQNCVTTTLFGDIAVDANTGLLYGIQFTGNPTLFQVDMNTCAETAIGQFTLPVGTFPSANALAFLPDGSIIIGGGTSIVYRTPTLVPIAPAVWVNFGTGTAAGDFVYSNGNVYVAWNGPGAGVNIYEVTIDAAFNYVSHVDLGNITGTIWGLTADCGGSLLGVGPNTYVQVYPGNGNLTFQDLPYNGPATSIWGAAPLNTTLSELCDTDQDGIPNHFDLDSDNDGLSDAHEACGDLTLVLETCMLDNDGSETYPDIDIDGCPDGLVAGACPFPQDSDFDGVPDFLEPDSDNDGCNDSAEGGSGGVIGVDVWGDNTIVDSCGLLLNGNPLGVCITPIDTSWHTYETDIVCNIQCNFPGPDKDNDNIPDQYDWDDDNDGIADTIECNGFLVVDTLNSFYLNGVWDYQNKPFPAGFNFVAPVRTNYTFTYPNTNCGDVTTTVRAYDGGQKFSGYNPLGLVTFSNGLGIGDGQDDTGGAPCTEFGYEELTAGETMVFQFSKKVEVHEINLSVFLSLADQQVWVVRNDLGIVVNTITLAGGAVNNVVSPPLVVELGETLEVRGGSLAVELAPGQLGACRGDGLVQGFKLAIFCEECQDTDNDGITDDRDLDSDNDGIPDAIEYCGSFNLVLENCSLDDDGNATYPDYDGDGCPDGLVQGTICPNIDADNDGIPNYLDLDSDNDGCLDSDEGMSSNVIGVNEWGNPALVDDCGLLLNGGLVGVCISPLDGTWLDPCVQSQCADKDNDGVSDYLDVDDDNDGILDTTECALITGTFNSFGTGRGAVNTNDPNWRVQWATMPGNVLYAPVLNNAVVPSTISGQIFGPWIPSPNPIFDWTTYNWAGIGPNVGLGNHLDLDLDGNIGESHVSANTTIQTGPSGDFTKLIFRNQLTLPANCIPNTFKLNFDIAVDNAAKIYVNGLWVADVGINEYSNSFTFLTNLTIATGWQAGVNLVEIEVLSGPGGVGLLIIDPMFTCNEFVDTDNDGISNCMDLDSDNDGIPDAVEGCSDLTLVLENCMLDNDGSSNYPDLDGDGCPDGLVDGIACNPVDTDNDGVDDYLELDSDNDGCGDAVESGSSSSNPNVNIDIIVNPGVSVDPCGLVLTGVASVCHTPQNDSWIVFTDSLLMDIVGVQPTCSNNSGGSIDLSVSGGTGVYTYQWNNGPTSQDQTGVIGGTYIVTVTDESGCWSAIDSIMLNQFNSLLVDATSININCNGGTDGSATANTTGGTTPYTYTWNNGNSTQTITGLTQGAYTVTVTSSDGCSGTATTTITEPTGITINITGINTSCTACIGTNDASINGGIPPYTYNWSNGATVEDLTGLCAGIYTLTATDSNGCTQTGLVNIASSNTFGVSSIGVDNHVTCNGGCDGAGTVAATGGQVPYSYQWGNGSTTSTVTGLCAGAYPVTVTDLNGCKEVTGVLITEPPAIVININPNGNVTCNGLSDGSATATANGGVSPYTYQWDSGETTPSATMLDAGIHIITVTDASNCTSTSSITITEPDLLSATTAVDNNVSCNGLSDGGATVTATGGTIPYGYQWDSGEVGSSATMLDAGTHTVTLTDANNCTIIVTVTITEPDLLSATTAVDNNVSCNGLSDGGATVIATGGTVPYGYQWDSGEVGSSATMLDAGTHSVTVTDANNCTTIATVTITEPDLLSATTAVDNNVSCNGLSDGGATVTATGGTIPYGYQWDSGEVGPSATMLDAGTHTVTVTDANNCTTIATVTITEPDLLSATTAVDNNVSCNGLSDGGATVTATGGTIPYGYQWDSGEVGSSATMLDAGTHTVTVTDANNCTTIVTVTITEPDLLAVITAVDKDVSCNGLSDGGATVTAIGGTIPYGYQWDSGEVGPSATNLDAGTHTVTVTDANNCTTIVTVTITEPDLLSATTAVDKDVSCNGLSDGGATVTATGGTIPYGYQWDSGEAGSSATMLDAGTHSVTVTDANNCTTIVTVTITEPDLLSATTAVDNNVSCNGLSDGGATVTATGGTIPYGYQWNNGEVGSSATMLDAGTHSVTVTDANNCTTIATVTITEPDLLSATTAVDNNVSCNGLSDGGATVTATGGTVPYGYQWDSGEVGSSATMLDAGTHTVTVTDANNCTTITTVTITEPDLLSATTAVDSNVSCNGLSDGGATVTATGGTVPYGYQWDSGEVGSSATVLDAGTHTVTVTDANNCTTIATITITEPDLLSATTAVDNNVSCNGLSDGGATVTATGGTIPYGYQWDSGEVGSSATMLDAGTHTVTVTDANNCTTIATVTITEPDLLSAATAVDNNVSCNGLSDGGATVTATGGTVPYGYQWDSGEVGSSATMLDAGTHSVTVTDANGCVTIETILITEPAALSATAVVNNNISCNGLSDGSATVSAMGGTIPYGYQWDSGHNGQSATNLDAGTHSVTVTDANNCATVTSVLITEPAVLSATAVVNNNVSCNGLSDGSATVSATGGTIPYGYQWDSGHNGQSATNLNVGNHSVTVTDANNCTAIVTVTITEPTTLLLSTTLVANVSCNGLSDGSATAIPAGGTTPYTFLWDNSEISSTAINLSAGTHSVTVTDANGCSNTASINVTEPTVLSSATILLGNVSCNGLSDGSATVVATGGTPPYNHLWDTGTTGTTANNLNAGIHNVTTTDVNNCTTVSSVTISQPPPLLISTAIAINVSCNGLSDGSSTATGAGGTNPYVYQWDSGHIGPSATNLDAGIHTVVVTDANGCTATGTTIITEPSILTATTSSNNVSCNSLSDGNATITAAGGTGPYSYIWSTGQTGNLLVNVSAGNYGYTVTDSNGCTNMNNVTITEPTVLSLTVSGGNVSCFGGNDGQAVAFPAGGTPPYSYAWSNGETTPTAISYTAGNHTLVITDANGCMETTSFTIGTPTALQLVSSTGTPVSCYGGNDGDASIIVTGGTPPYSYNWSDGQVTNPAVGLAAGTYTVTVSDANSCSFFINITVTEPTTPIDPIISSTDVSCFGLADGTVTASPTGGTPGYTYVWNNGATTPSLLSVITGSYTVTVTDQNGCKAIASAFVDSPTMVVAQTQIEDATCDGYNDGSLSVVNPSGGMAPYLYAINGGPFGVDSLFSGVEAGTYTITVQDADGCDFELNNLIVEDNPPILIDIAQAPSFEILLGDSIQLIPTISPIIPYTYDWSPTQWLSCTDCEMPWAAPLETTTYTLLVTDTLDGCTAEEPVTVVVDKQRNVYIPNVFTPNGDGVNDAFYVFGGLGVTNIKVMKLYDRWGETVFEGLNLPPSDPSYGWDGRFKDQQMNSAVFVYYVEVEFIDGEVISYKGDFTIVR